MPEAEHADDPHLNCDEVARLINAAELTGRTVRGWHKDSRMPDPDARVGNVILWRKSTILAWLQLGCPVLVYPDPPGRGRHGPPRKPTKGDKSGE